MGYRDNVALDYEALSPERQARVAPRLRPSFGVVEGGGLDASVRRGVSLQFLFNIKVLLSIVMLLVAIGFVRVALLSASVATLQHNKVLTSTIEQAQMHNSELKVEHSILANSNRIGRIAMQSYGMVLPEKVDTINIAGPSSDASESSQQ